MNDATHIILLADDDAGICTVVRQSLVKQGLSVRVTDNGRELLEWVDRGLGSLVITDVLMPEMNGLDALREIHEVRPDLPVIVMSAQTTLMTAVEADKRGAVAYFPKPFDLRELTEKVLQLLPSKKPKKTEKPAASAESGAALIGTSEAMQDVFKTIAKLVQVDLTVMLKGESGTGKEVIANAIHDLSVRKDAPFVAVNMAALPKDLVESELFGYEKGAFTGAGATRKGKFAMAEGGTLFLDEIGDMPLEAQTRLLRVLQEGEFSPVGSTRSIQTDIRIICATHRDIQQLCNEGRFREDLFYRLNVVPIDIPPLRARKADIPALTEHFLLRAIDRNLPKKPVEKTAMKLLEGYHWPGNVRELENLIYRLLVLGTDDAITADDVRAALSLTDQNSSGDGEALELLEQRISKAMDELAPDWKAMSGSAYANALECFERPLLASILAATGGNQIQASEILGLNRNTVRKKIQENGLDVVHIKKVTKRRPT